MVTPPASGNAAREGFVYPRYSLVARSAACGAAGNGEPPATGTVVAEFTQEESILVDDPSLQANQLSEVTGQIIATVAWDGERWRVTDMTIAPPEGEASDAGGATG